MDQQPTESQKRKRALPRQMGCLKWLLIPIVLAVACYGGIWVFARYGGEWVMSDQIPLPPDSQLIHITYGDDPLAYGNQTVKVNIYAHPWSPKALWDWFEQQGIGLAFELRSTSDPLDSRGSIRENASYYQVVAYRRDTIALWLYDVAIRSTSFSECLLLFGGSDLKVYKTKITFDNIKLPDGLTAFSITTCWPNVK